MKPIDQAAVSRKSFANAFANRRGFVGAVLFAWILFAAGPGLSAEKPIPVILDTDIGTDVDDAYALVLAARNLVFNCWL
jgi:hypothetical protein